jgi:hypothetical protein
MTDKQRIVSLERQVRQMRHIVLKLSQKRGFCYFCNLSGGHTRRCPVYPLSRDDARNARKDA